MKNYIIYLFISLCSIKAYSQLGSEDETIEVTVEFETTDVGPYYKGGSDNIYTPITSYKGNVYFLWIDKNRRPKLGQIKKGIVTTEFLDKDEENIYQVQQDGHNKFSIGIDKDGYIHIIGDLHHYGAESTFVYLDKYDDKYNLYWVSENPEDITSFEFRGGDIEKVTPGIGFSYPSFHSDMNGELYVRHRAKIGTGGHYDGEMGWVAARYNLKTKKWIEIGKKTPSDFHGWYDYKPLYKAIFWEDNGVGKLKGRSWYQGFSGDMRFDFNNRWHVATLINNNSEKGFMTDLVYAYSDDGGVNFHKADGSPISQLPIRVEKGANQGSIVANSSDAPEGFFLVSSVCADKEGTPVITYTKLDSKISHGYATATYKYWDKKNKTWTKEKRNPVGGLIRHTTVLDANGVLSYISPHDSGKIIREFGLTPTVSKKATTRLKGCFMGIDQRGIREKNVIRGFLFEKDSDTLKPGKLKIVSMEGISKLAAIPDKWSTTLMGNARGDKSGLFKDIYQLKSTGVFEESFSGQYVNQTIKGNFELEVRVINVNYVTDSSFAGIMVRDNNEEVSSFFGVAVTSYKGVKTISRNVDKFNTTLAEGYEPSEWLKIKRVGNLLESYRSDNGEVWTKLDSREINMTTTVSCGLIAGSGNSQEISHARIDHVSITKIEN